MMKTPYTHTNLMTFSVVFVIGLLLSSCGSYQQATYGSTDGIYTGDGQDTQQDPQNQERVSDDQSVGNQVIISDYESYFGNRAEVLDQAIQYRKENEVFTDVDSYSS